MGSFCIHNVGCNFMFIQSFCYMTVLSEGLFSSCQREITQVLFVHLYSINLLFNDCNKCYCMFDSTDKYMDPLCTICCVNVYSCFIIPLSEHVNFLDDLLEVKHERLKTVQSHAIEEKESLVKKLEEIREEMEKRVEKKNSEAEKLRVSLDCLIRRMIIFIYILFLFYFILKCNVQVCIIVLISCDISK